MTKRHLISFNINDLPVYESEVLIIGGGIAGLTTAFICGQKFNVTVLTKAKVKQASTWYAQGGIAAALGPQDSAELHFQDTVKVGANLNDPEAVRVLVNEAKAAIQFLVDLGMQFDRKNGQYLLAQEGGHTLPRVLHAGDTTGSAIALTLAKAVSGLNNVNLAEDLFVIDLLTTDKLCFGVLAYDKVTNQKAVFLAKAVVIAAGGVGQLFQVTTNPQVATADGLAMAHRAGAELRDMEFVQFHPTALDVNENPRFLISEALRGEGAYLVNRDGHRFMVSQHKLAELAPRDVVSQTVAKLNQQGVQVYLDARHLGATFLKKRFPGIYEYCLKKGFNLATDLVPVKPAAHFLVGGIKTNLHGGTNIAGLYACGETASVGVHGANRLASNSLLEGLVFGRRLGFFLNSHLKELSLKSRPQNFSHRKPALISDWLKERLNLSQEQQKAASLQPKLTSQREQLKAVMQESMGVLRKRATLKQAAQHLEAIQEQVNQEEYATVFDWETQNMLAVALVMIKAALKRRESVGVHRVSE